MEYPVYTAEQLTGKGNTLRLMEPLKTIPKLPINQEDKDTLLGLWKLAMSNESGEVLDYIDEERLADYYFQREYYLDVPLEESALIDFSADFPIFTTNDSPTTADNSMTELSWFAKNKKIVIATVLVLVSATGAWYFLKE